MHLAKIQIGLHISTVWSESSMGAFLITGVVKYLHADNEDWSDSVDAQADYCLRWVHMSEGTFSQASTRILSGTSHNHINLVCR